jgi:effector-binding domain-containing protein
MDQLQAKVTSLPDSWTGGKVACVTIHGDKCHYPELLSAYDAAVDWIQKNGFETTQPPREIWYTGPGPDAKWEIVWLFK